MTLALARLAPTDEARVAHITVAPEQIKFSGTVQEAFADAEADVDFHTILQDAHPVGFFKIDRTYAQKYPFVQGRGIGLRAFIIDHAFQGRGIATAAVRLLPAYLAQHYDAGALYLTVNMSNPAAIACYLRGGFKDTGEIWEKGIAGPQHVMRMKL